MENAALLARVSTKGQEDNSSPDSQLERGRAYCEAKGYHIVTERIEVMSGSFVLARSVFNELLDLAADGKISIIVSDIPDRLGRGETIAILKHLAKQNGAHIEYAQPGRDTNTEEGFITDSVEQLVSGIERQNIRRRTRGGKYDWAKQGRVIAASRRPYGYQFVSTYDGRGHKVSCVLVIVEDEAKIVRYIYRLLVEELLPLHAITVRLNQEGIPAPGGGRWLRPTLHKIISNATYKGTWYFGKRDQKRIDTVGGVTSRTKLRPVEETVEVPCPAIVEGILWDAAQEQLERNKQKFIKPTVQTYSLRGRIRCACGRKMCGSFCPGVNGEDVSGTGRRGYRYYSCNRKVEGNALCGSKRVRADLLERVVWEAVSGELRNIDKLIRKVKEQQADSGHKRQRVQQAIAATQAQIDKANTRYGRFESLYGDGLLTKQKLAEYRAERDAELQRREAEQQELEQQLTVTAELSSDFEKDLRELQQALSLRLTPDTPDEVRQKIYEMLRVECEWHSDKQRLTVRGLMGSRTLTPLLA